MAKVNIRLKQNVRVKATVSAGKKGEQGDTGATGATGETGATGPAGVTEDVGRRVAYGHYDYNPAGMVSGEGVDSTIDIGVGGVTIILEEDLGAEPYTLLFQESVGTATSMWSFRRSQLGDRFDLSCYRGNVPYDGEVFFEVIALKAAI